MRPEPNGGSQSKVPPEAGGLRVAALQTDLSAWLSLIKSSRGTAFYHSERWIRLLIEAYGFAPMLASVSDSGEMMAACLLVGSRNPLIRRMVSFPFSDLCPPVARTSRWLSRLMAALVADSSAGYELRGAVGAPPWQHVDCFIHGTFDLDRSAAAMERAMDRNFRRNLRRAREAGLTVECARGPADMDRFYLLQLQSRRRLGVPCQPRRLFRLAHRIFNEAGGIDTWFVRLDGRDLAGLVLLREGDLMAAKWAARADDVPTGSSHLLFWSVMEHFAGKASILDMGRVDRRNGGLIRFKREMGVDFAPLPYAFYPRAPRHVSVETPQGMAALVANVLRRSPLWVTRVLGELAYGYLV